MKRDGRELGDVDVGPDLLEEPGYLALAAVGCRTRAPTCWPPRRPSRRRRRVRRGRRRRRRGRRPRRGAGRRRSWDRTWGWLFSLMSDTMPANAGRPHRENSPSTIAGVRATSPWWRSPRCSRWPRTTRSASLRAPSCEPPCSVSTSPWPPALDAGGASDDVVDLGAALPRLHRPRLRHGGGVRRRDRAARRSACGPTAPNPVDVVRLDDRAGPDRVSRVSAGSARCSRSSPAAARPRS